MTRVEKTIEIGRPLRTVYDQWTQFEEFPRFMEGVEEVQQLDDRHLRWKARIAGKVETWDAEIVQQTPDELISWRHTRGAIHRGVVLFRPLDAERTELAMAVEFEPQGLVEKVGEAVGVVSRRVEGDLERFKKFIEERGSATGAWRGAIAPGGHAGHPE